MSIIRKTAMNESVTNSDKLRETILSDLIDRPTPTDAGLAQLKEDVKAFL
jgi:transcriptional regulator of met regulon